jgi:hypothetical protein
MYSAFLQDEIVVFWLTSPWVVFLQEKNKALIFVPAKIKWVFIA